MRVTTWKGYKGNEQAWRSLTGCSPCLWPQPPTQSFHATVQWKEAIKNFNLSTTKLNVYCLWYEVVIGTIKAYLYGSKDMVSVLDKEGLGYGYVLGSTWDVFILDSVNFADYGGQMSQHLNCECWSLITVDTYHGWMLADLHSGISWDGVNDYHQTNVLK